MYRKLASVDVSKAGRPGQGLSRLAAIVLLFAAALASVAQPMRISRSTRIVVSAGEPEALRRAAGDFAGDLRKVFGSEAGVPADALDHAGPTAICISLGPNGLSAAPRPAGAEILRMETSTRALPDGRSQQVLLLTGSDLRGAIYAVYDFSQRELGIDPMYFWTGRRPRTRTSILLPAGFARQGASPTFTHRGFFINDEDLLTGWRPGTKDGTGIALEVWDKIFETILRLKGDMVVPGTLIFPDEPQVRAATARGLILSQHHLEILGTNTYRWPADVPYSYTANRPALESAWRHSIAAYPPAAEIIWTAGFRGKDDRPFWVDDASAGSTDADHARTIQSAIKGELQLLKESGRSGPVIFNAWSEAAAMMRKGLIQLPAGVTLVWPDNGRGTIQDQGSMGRGQGVYFHTAMANYMANQLTEAVTPQRIQGELGRAVRAGATSYLLINTSDLRPVPMSTRAAMDLAWEAGPWLSDPAYAQRFVRQWSAEEFGGRAADAMTRYYEAFYAAPGRYAPDDFPLTDNAYHTVLREFLVGDLTGATEAPEYGRGNATNFREYVHQYIAIAGQACARWKLAEQLAERAHALIDPRGEEPFRSHVRAQLEIDASSNRALYEIAQAVDGQDRTEKVRHMDAAIAALRAVQTGEKEAEHGDWQGFYRGDLFVDVPHSLELALAYRDHLLGAPIPPGMHVTIYDKDRYGIIKSYQGKRTLPL